MRRSIDAMVGRLELSDEIENDLRILVKSLEENPNVVDGRRIKKFAKQRGRQYWRARSNGVSHFYRVMYYLKPYRKMVIVTKIGDRDTVYQGSFDEKFRRVPFFRLAYPFMADQIRFDWPDRIRSLDFGSQAPPVVRFMVGPKGRIHRARQSMPTDRDLHTVKHEKENSLEIDLEMCRITINRKTSANNGEMRWKYPMKTESG